MKKKILALCLVVVLVATAITGVTLAYFTDYTQVAKNTFTVGDIEIKLDEEDIDNPGERTEDGNEYTDIYPGVTLPKDPTVTVLANSEDCYVRMIVTVNVDTLKNAFPVANFANLWNGNVFLLQNLVDWNTDWEVRTDAVGLAAMETGKYEFWYKDIVAEATTDNELPALFTEITIPENMTNTQIAYLDEFAVDIYAEAIQSANFGGAADAWGSFTRDPEQITP